MFSGFINYHQISNVTITVSKQINYILDLLICYCFSIVQPILLKLNPRHTTKAFQRCFLYTSRKETIWLSLSQECPSLVNLLDFWDYWFCSWSFAFTVAAHVTKIMQDFMPEPDGVLCIMSQNSETFDELLLNFLQTFTSWALSRTLIVIYASCLTFQVQTPARVMKSLSIVSVHLWIFSKCFHTVQNIHVRLIGHSTLPLGASVFLCLSVLCVCLLTLWKTGVQSSCCLWPNDCWDWLQPSCHPEQD